MKNFTFLLFLFVATLVITGCQPAKQGGYDTAPSQANNLQDEVDAKTDSSIEKAIAKDSLHKKVFHF